MINYVTDILPLQQAGVSDSDITVHLNSKTLYPMQSEECKYILQDNAAVLLDPVKVDQRSGSLIDYYQSLEAGDAKDLIAFFLGRIYAGQPVSTDQYPRSIQFASVEASLPESLKEVSAKLVEAAGGRPHSGVTEADVIASREAYEQAEAERIEQEQQAQAEAEAEQLINQQLLERESRYTQLFNQYIASALIDQRIVDEAAWVAGIQAMADNFVE